MKIVLSRILYFIMALPVMVYITMLLGGWLIYDRLLGLKCLWYEKLFDASLEYSDKYGNFLNNILFKGEV